MSTFDLSPLNGFEIEPQIKIDESCALYLTSRNSVAGHATIKIGNIFSRARTYICYESQHKTPEERDDIGTLRDDSGDTTRSPPLANRERVLG